MRWFILIFVLCLPEPVAAWPACDGRDLLRGARVTGVELGGDPARLAGGELATEGAPWRGPRAVVLQAQGSSITFDLGGPRDVRHLLVQADANDLYLLRGSLDGRAWQDLWRIPSQAPYEGLRSRVAVLSPPARVRYLRLEVARGDGRHSISGLRAHCRQPWTWPPASVAATAPVELRLQDGGQQAVVTPARVRVLKVTVAVLAALMLLWGAARSWLSRWRKIGAAPPWLRRGALAVLGLTAAACWYNGGKFHFDEYVHTWEVYHYYMGAKYFPELAYTRLYDCSVVADQEAASARGPACGSSETCAPTSWPAPPPLSGIRAGARRTFRPRAGGRSPLTPPGSGARCPQLAGRRPSRTTATTPRRCGASWGARWPPPGRPAGARSWP